MKLTREQILEMPAGPEMDALVAELVMKWRPWNSGLGPRGSAMPDCWETRSRRNPTVRMSGWRPSADIADAWKVLEAIREKPWDTITVTYDAGEYGLSLHEDCGRDVDYASCESAPLAICRAALLATLEP